jgi:hypothetical protein
MSASMFFSPDDNDPIAVTSDNVFRACVGIEFEVAVSALITALVHVLAQTDEKHRQSFGEHLKVALPGLVAKAGEIAAEKATPLH